MNPNSAEVLDCYATSFLVARGRFDEAIAMLKRALELDPVSPSIYTDLGGAYFCAREFDHCVGACQTALRLDRHFYEGHLQLAGAYLEMGKAAEALTEYRTALQLTPERPGSLSGLGRALATTGHRAEAQQILADLEQLARKRFVPKLAKAMVYLGLGEKGLALDWLDMACEGRECYMAYLVSDPTMDPLRNEPRFQALLKKVGHDP